MGGLANKHGMKYTKETMCMILRVWSVADGLTEQNWMASWKCPECSGNLVTHQGFIVCRDCGIVLSREYVSPTFQMGEEQRHDTPDVEVYGSLGNRFHIVDGLGSYIGHYNDRFFRDANGQALPARIQKKFRRLKLVYSTRVRIGPNEAKYRALRALNHVSKMLMLNEQVRNRTAYLYKKILNESPEKITNNILLVAVCLFISIREFGNGAPITLEEIADAFERAGYRISVRAIVREAFRLKISIGQAPIIRKPEDYLPRVVSMLVNNQKIIKKIKMRGWDLREYEIALRKVMSKVISIITPAKRGGRNPFIFAASVAYASDKIIAKERGRKFVLTQKMVSEATDVAEYSIRDHYSMIKKVIQEHSIELQNTAICS